MLDIQHAVITETVCGSEVCCQCLRYVADLSISDATTVEVIASTRTSDATVCGKRKYSNIYLDAGQPEVVQRGSPWYEKLWFCCL